MSIVILLNLGGENWSIDVRIGLIEILHYTAIESEVKVKIVITVVQEVMILEVCIQKV